MARPTATALTPTGERRPGLITKSFSLEFKQVWRQAGTGTLITDMFRLSVTDTDNNLYVLAPATVTDEEDLIALMLRRIAMEKGQVGWKFEGMFFATEGVGIIIG